MARLFKNIQNLLTLKFDGNVSDSSVSEEKKLGILSQAAFIESQGRIRWVGDESELSLELIRVLCGNAEVEEVDLEGRDVLPGFVESHTHLVFAGDRSEEFEMRNQGISYQEISAKGGGILSTVKATRKATEAQLLSLAQQRLNRFAKQGVVLCEVKSGYGLSHEEEIKMLKVARQLKGPEVVTTYLGPHAKSPDVEFEKYFEEILNKTLPEVVSKQLADRADIFIEQGFYTREHGKKYYQKARQLGLGITGHVEQLSHQGGATLAAEFAASSVDHVVEITDTDIQVLKGAGTVCVLLPGADFYLQMKYPRARKLIEQGVAVALATDFNPGSCPTQDLSFIGVLARLQMKMSLSEVIIAYTKNAAKALGKENDYGSIEPGKFCDFVVLEDSYRALFYQAGYHPISSIYRKGKFLEIEQIH